ncbi:hypothetical protein LTR53_014837, partial [Teratosphaeriaceae sp. CCFEE 6253]
PPPRSTGSRSWRTPHTPVQPYRHANSYHRNVQTLTATSPAYRRTSNKLQLNESRKKICQKSPFWHEDFDLPQHQDDWRAGESRRQQARIDRTRAEASEKARLEQGAGEPFPPLPPLRPLFNNKVLLAQPDGSLSAVLAQKTLFCPAWQAAKDDFAPWPQKHEMDYEGESRLATDRLHRRFLPLPRVETDAGINWQHRVAIPQYAFEEYYATFPKSWGNPLGVSWEEVFFRAYRVAELEFTDPVTDAVDGEGWHGIGESLMEALEPRDQWV